MYFSKHIRCVFTYCFLLLANFSYGQVDSSLIQFSSGLRGMWQRGNLNQINLMPNAKVIFIAPKHFAEIAANYHFIKVEGLEAKNDLWINGLYQFKPERRFFPSVHTILGFAKSFRIDHSMVAGAGGGINFIKNTSSQYFQFHLYASHLNFKFEAETALKSFSIGSRLRTKIPISQLIQLQWEWESYYALENNNYWGGSHLLGLFFHLNKHLSVNVSHQSYYSHQTATDIEKLNTQLLFGFQYSFSN